MPRTDDMMPPATSGGQPQMIRSVRRDMIHKIATDDKIGILDLNTWMMARSYDEKRTLISDCEPGQTVIAWCGGRWTDFFEFPPGQEGENIFEALTSALTPRRSVMITEDEADALEAFRQGAIVQPTRVTGKRTVK